MSNPWPERRIIGTDEEKRSGTAPFVESDGSYLISMLQQLFVEIAQVKAMLEKPLYQINVHPEPGGRVYADRFWIQRDGAAVAEDTNDRSDDMPVNSSLKDM